jgi:hypothetical protein
MVTAVDDGGSVAELIIPEREPPELGSTVKLNEYPTFAVPWLRCIQLDVEPTHQQPLGEVLTTIDPLPPDAGKLAGEGETEIEYVHEVEFWLTMAPWRASVMIVPSRGDREVFGKTLYAIVTGAEYVPDVGLFSEIHGESTDML